MSKRTLITCLTVLFSLVSAHNALADATPQVLPFAQAWSDVSLISADDDWTSIPGIVGYRGDDLTAAAGADPQAIVADGSGTPVDLIANQRNPAALFTGGLAEFELADPTVALQPSGAADGPHLVLSLDTSGFRDIEISYLLRDLDASSDDAAQPIALQYRLGSDGPFINVPAGYVADATTGPRLADRVTAVRALLPADASDRTLVQVRVVAANAVNNDEWVGIDDIAASGTSVDSAPPILSVTIGARQRLLRALARGLRPLVSVDEASSVRCEIRIGRRLAQRLGLPIVVARAKTSMAAAGETKVIVPFSPRARRKLAQLRSVAVALRTKAIDTSDQASRATKRIVLVR